MKTKLKFLSALLSLIYLIPNCNNFRTDFTPYDENNNIRENSTEDNNSNNNENISDDTIPKNVENTVEETFEEEDYFDSRYFIYNLIKEDLSNSYDTNYATVNVSENKIVEGFSFTDYSSGYESEDGQIYFSSNFISFPNEENITDKEKENGLEILINNSKDDKYSFVYDLEAEDIHKHLIINNTYVSYDIINNSLSYNESEYQVGMDLDISRGNLYNYDTNEFDYIVEPTTFVPTTGISLIGQSTYQEIIDEINNIINTQDINLSYQELQTQVEKSKELFNSYLLGLQEETFLGIPTQDLITITNSLDPMQHLRLGVDYKGNTTIHIIEIDKLPSVSEKVVTGIICGLGAVLGLVCNIVGKAVPVVAPILSSLGGALTGAAIEAFTQVIINNTAISDINWAKIGIAAASGAVSGLITGGLDILQIGSVGLKQTLMLSLIDIMCDGLVGGLEQYALAKIDGKTIEEAQSSFGEGVLAGLIVSAGFKIITSVGSKVSKLVKTKIAAKKSLKQVIDNGQIILVKDIPEDFIDDYKINYHSKKGASEALEKLTDTSSRSYALVPYEPDFRTRRGIKILNSTKKHIFEYEVVGKGKFEGLHSFKYLEEKYDKIYWEKKPTKFDDFLKSISEEKRNKPYILNKISIMETIDETTSIYTKDKCTLFPPSWSKEKIYNSINDTLLYGEYKGISLKDSKVTMAFVYKVDDFYLIAYAEKDILITCFPCTDEKYIKKIVERDFSK